MNRNRLPFIALMLALVLSLLTMSLVVAQSGSERNHKGKTISNVPARIPSLTGGPDAGNYIFADSNEANCNTTFNDISNINPALAGVQNGSGLAVTAPFSITLYNTQSTDILIGNSGLLAVGATSGFLAAPTRVIPRRMSASEAFVMPFWGRLGLNVGGVYTASTGITPDRQFIVQWDRPHSANPAVSDTISFQVVFYENNPKIDFVYADASFGNAAWDNGADATIGLNQNSSNALEYSFNTPAILTGTNPVSAICFDRPDSIALAVTVGTDPTICADTNALYTVDSNLQVYYCYEVTNTSLSSISTHSLVDSELGTILNADTTVLAPLATMQIMRAATLSSTTINIATWDADTLILRDTFTDTATATVTFLTDTDNLLCDGGPVRFESGIPSSWSSAPSTGSGLWRGIVTTGQNRAGGTLNYVSSTNRPPISRTLTSNIFDIPATASSVTLTAKLYAATNFYRPRNLSTPSLSNHIENNGARSFTFDIEIWDGSLWNTIASYGGSSSGPGAFPISLDLSTYTGQNGAQIRFINSGGSGSSETFRTYIDDIELVCMIPTAVELSSFTATAQSDGSVAIEWETAAEWEHAGFNVYRSATENGALDQVNEAIVAAIGIQGQGASYLLTDRDTNNNTQWYTLKDIDIHGVTTLHGPISVEPHAPTAVAIQQLDTTTTLIYDNILLLIAVILTISLVAFAKSQHLYQAKK